MADKKTAETTIRIFASTKEKLKDLKLGKEGDAVVIERILKENKELRKDKELLYKIALNNSDSMAFPNNTHRATFVITRIVFDGGIDDGEKIGSLKKLLAEMLENDSGSVTASIEIIKDMLNTDGEPVPKILLDFESYVNDIN